MKTPTKPFFRFCIPSTDLMNIRKKLVSKEVYFIAGSHSITIPCQRVKFLSSDVAKLWPNLAGDKIFMTPAEIARTELKREFPDLVKVGWLSQHVVLLDKRPPMLFTGKYQGDGVYIDLKAAYWQLYRRLWLNVLHPCGIPMNPLGLMEIAERLKDNKQARNAIVGITRSRSAVGFRGKETIRLKTKNPFLSPPLWATIMDILQAIAWMAKESGAVYICTDGYLFPSYADWRGFDYFLDDKGLYHTLKTGYVDIRGWGAYSVSGFKETIPFTQKRLTGTSFPLNNVEKELKPLWKQLLWWENLPK